MYFEKPINSILIANVVVMFPTSKLSMSLIEIDVVTLEVCWAILKF